MNRSKKGFTLVELIVAMSVMLILATITVYGVRSMMQSSKASSTRVLLQNAESIFDEWRRAAGDNGRSLSQTYAAAILPKSLSADDPNNFRADDPNNFRTGKAVRLTRGMMFRMSQVPAVRKMINALPADRLLAFPIIDPTPISAAAAQLNNPAIFECSAGNSYICYYQNPAYPGVSADYAANPTTGVGAPGGAPWRDFWLQTSNQTPVFRDAWNNPLIMFPACGFMVGNDLHTSTGVFTLGSNDPHWKSGGNYTVGDLAIFEGGDGVWHLYRCVRPHASTSLTTPTSGVGTWEQIPSRPFFASAGPDGVFYDPAKPDTFKDNLYSYER